MDPADEKLLEEDILAPQDSKRYNYLVFIRHLSTTLYLIDFILFQFLFFSM